MVISTDSVLNNSINDSKMKIISVAPLFAEAIVRIHNRESISSLFDSVPHALKSYSSY